MKNPRTALRCGIVTLYGLVGLSAVASLVGAQDGRGLQPLTSDRRSGFGRYHAIFFAVGDQSPRSDMTSLRHPLVEADTLRSVLVREYLFEPANVQIVRNATSAQILDALDSLSNVLGPDDNLLVVYSGHGHYDRAGEEGYWLPADAMLTKRSTWLPNSQIATLMRRLRARQVLIATDACFSGTLTRSGGGPSDSQVETIEFGESVARRTSRRTITAGSFDEVVPARSAFAVEIAKALRSNPGAIMTGGRLAMLIRPAVRQAAGTSVQWGSLSGVTDEQGDFVFVRRVNTESLAARSSTASPVVAPVSGRNALDSPPVERFNKPVRMIAGTRPDADATTSAPEARVPNARRMMVLTFRAVTPGNTGVQAADALRHWLGSDIPTKQLRQIPNGEISGILEASGSRIDEPISSSDARELGRQLRADEFVQGRVRRDGEIWRIEATLHLVRDPSRAQPLRLASAPSLGDAARLISAEIVEARKQLVPELVCESEAREKNWDRAMASAREGIALFPRAVIARTCLLNAMLESKAPDEAQLAIAEEILAIDSRSRRALSIAGDVYRRRNLANPRDTANANKMIHAYTRLVASDPTDLRLVDIVAKAIAGSGSTGVALPIIRKAVEDNPADAELLRTQFLVELAASEFRAAIRSGIKLAALDAAMADTSYFPLMARAYQADSQPAKASDEIAKGVAKFPENASLLVFAAQTQRAAGQTQQAVETLKKALVLDVAVERGNLLLAQLYYEVRQPESAYAALVAAQKTVDSTLVGNVALELGNKAQRELKPEATDAEYVVANNFLALANLRASNPERRLQAKLLSGTVSARRGRALLRVGLDGKNCQLIKQAQEQFTVAQVNIPAGARFAPQVADQNMTALGQLIPRAEQAQKAFCK